MFIRYLRILPFAFLGHFCFSQPIPSHTLYQQALFLNAQKDLKPIKLAVIKPNSHQQVTFIHWTSKTYPPGRQLTKEDTWVVLALDMKKRCRQYSSLSANALAQRIAELLGMPVAHDLNRWHFVLMEMPKKQYHFGQVNSQGFFRPCYSGDSILASSCHYQPKALSAYRSWLREQSKTIKAYPWTGLGYTYDWGADNKSHVGLDEYVIPKGQAIEIVKTVSAQSFCAI